jgi:CheY-like chemotaxis protein
MGLVLVTDDDTTCRDSIQKTLEREGHTVEGVPDVDRALEALARRHFDLIVCDYQMPGKTGLEFLAELKRTKSTIPMILISAFTDSETEATARRLGVEDLLKKPFRRRDLVEHALRLIQSPVKEAS